MLELLYGAMVGGPAFAALGIEYAAKVRRKYYVTTVRSVSERPLALGE